MKKYEKNAIMRENSREFFNTDRLVCDLGEATLTPPVVELA